MDKIVSTPQDLIGGNSYKFMLLDQKIIDYCISLIHDIGKLQEKGYTQDELYDLIINSDFTIDHEDITREEESFLKIYAIRVLDKRFKSENEVKELDNNQSLIKKLNK